MFTIIDTSLKFLALHVHHLLHRRHHAVVEVVHDPHRAADDQRAQEASDQKGDLRVTSEVVTMSLAARCKCRSRSLVEARPPSLASARIAPLRLASRRILVHFPTLVYVQSKLRTPHATAKSGRLTSQLQAFLIPGNDVAIPITIVCYFGPKWLGPKGNR